MCSYVQRNFATLRPRMDPMEFQREVENKAEKYLERGPNKDLLEHERKRRVEIKCIELQDAMEEQGCVGWILNDAIY